MIEVYDPEFPISSLASGWRAKLTSDSAYFSLISNMLVVEAPCSFGITVRPTEKRPWAEVMGGGNSVPFSAQTKLVIKCFAHGSYNSSTHLDYGPTSGNRICPTWNRSFQDESGTWTYGVGTSYEFLNDEIWPGYAIRPQAVTDNPSQVIFNVSLYYDGGEMRQTGASSLATGESITVQHSSSTYDQSKPPYRFLVSTWNLDVLSAQIYGTQILTPRGDIISRPPAQVEKVTSITPPKTKGGGWLPAIQR